MPSQGDVRWLPLESNPEVEILDFLFYNNCIHSCNYLNFRLLTRFVVNFKAAVKNKYC